MRYVEKFKRTLIKIDLREFQACELTHEWLYARMNMYELIEIKNDLRIEYYTHTHFSEMLMNE